MKSNEQRNSNLWLPFFPYGFFLMSVWLIVGLLFLILESYILAILYLVIFVVSGLIYGWDYCYVKKLLLNYDMEKINRTEVINDTEDIFLESIQDKKVSTSVDVKFDLSELGDKNTFLLIKIPSSFIDKFKKYNLSLNSPSILGKKIYEWGDRDNGMCIQNVLCFSKVEIKSTIDQVTNEVHAAIEWLPNEHGEQSKCIQKWVRFAWQ